MKKNARNISIGVGIGVGTAVTIIGQKVLSKKLFELAISRNTPKNIIKNKDTAITSSPRLKMLEEMKKCSDKLEGCICEKVEITSFDDIKLVGHYFHNENAKRIIIAMHGWRSSWSRDFGVIADFWHDNDCSVLYAEQRGQNASEGDYMGFGIVERYDCQKWANYIDSRTDGKLPIYLAGVSMGASTVLMATGLSLLNSVHGVIADCGFTSPRAIWKHVLQDNFHFPYKFVSHDIDHYFNMIAENETSYSCEDTLKNCKIPVLFVHGTDDHFVPVEMTYKNYTACSAPKRLLIVPGAEHRMSCLIDKEGYEAATKQFWANFDS